MMNIQKKNCLNNEHSEKADDPIEVTDEYLKKVDFLNEFIEEGI